MDIVDASILEEFVIESQEHFEKIEDDILRLSRHKGVPAREDVDKIFRAIHTVKGCASFLQLDKIGEMAHIMETVLSALRDGEMKPETDVINRLLAGIDMLNIMLSEVEQSNEFDISDIYDRLSVLLEEKNSQNELKSDICLQDSEGSEIGFEISRTAVRNLTSGHEFLYALKYNLTELFEKKGKSPGMLVRSLLETGEIVASKVDTVSEETHEDLPDRPLVYTILYSTSLAPDVISDTLDMSKDTVILVDNKEKLLNMNTKSVNTDFEKTSQTSFNKESDPKNESLDDITAKKRAGSEANTVPRDTRKTNQDDISESRELLKHTLRCLTESLEQPEKAGGKLAAAFRMIRRFREKSGYLDLKDSERLSRKIENTIESFKNNSPLWPSYDTKPLSEGITALQKGLSDFSENGTREIQNCDDLIRKIKLSDDSAADEPGRASGDVPEGNKHLPIKAPDEVNAASEGASEENKRVPGKPEETINIAKASDSGDISGYRTADRKPAEDKHFSRKPEEKTEPKKAAKKSDSGDISRHRTAEQNLRVDLKKLDMLIDLVGELVIAESMVTSNPDLAGLELENFERSARDLKRIITDIQDVAMSMRMIPLSKTFRKTTRLVYDLSRKVEKRVELELIGEETEVDKTVIEHIDDPLIHIIRNCVDHGIELPRERTALGKPETGKITIEAKHEGGEVLIRISDDGRGLSREKILARGIEKGLIRDNGKRLSDQDVFRLIFEPGFSTTEKVTEVSGRGVGLDVVKKNIEKMKGKADIQSIPGKGTTIILSIPLTLAIIDGMIVRVGSSSYTIPLLSIHESFRPHPNQVTIAMDGQEIVRVREDMIPVIRLHEVYNLTPERTELCKGILINVSSGSKCVCLFADEIIGHHQTVIKGMPNYVASARGISGCTILGDGEVSLILDVGKLIDIAGNSR